MSYEQGEGKIVMLMEYFPEEMRKDSTYDIIKNVVDIADPYELTNREIEKIFKKCFGIFTGESDTSTLTIDIGSYLGEERQEYAQKVADALIDIVITPIKKALGDKFPIKMTVSDGAGSVVVDEENLDRESILNGIENPVKSKERSSRFDLKEVEIRPEMIPEEIYPEIQKVERGLPKPSISRSDLDMKREKPKSVGSIVEQKMSGMSSLPKTETTLRPQSPASKPLTKSYEKDPYREALK